MDGLHIIANLYDCNYNFETEDNIFEQCIYLCQKAELQIVGKTSHRFEPQGLTFAILLAESHLCIHTWPEKRSVCFDIYTCNHTQENKNKAIFVFEEIQKILKPAKIISRHINREFI